LLLPIFLTSQLFSWFSKECASHWPSTFYLLFCQILSNSRYVLTAFWIWMYTAVGEIKQYALFQFCALLWLLCVALCMLWLWELLQPLSVLFDGCVKYDYYFLSFFLSYLLTYLLNTAESFLRR
jgi:hypothetical protein